MAQSFSYPSDKTGLPPGSLVHVGRMPAEAGRVTLISFNEDHAAEHPVASIDDIDRHRAAGTNLWIHCEGLDLIEFLGAVGLRFAIHPLVLEDILNTHQRPKFEVDEDYLFIVLKTLRCDQSMAVRHEQISLVVFGDVLFTFREQADDLFDALRQRLTAPKGRLRSLGTDYLACMLMDTVVDNYFTVADTIEEAIEAAETTLLDRPQPATFAAIQQLKRELIFIRKAVMPLREMLLAIQRCDSPLIQDRTQPYFRDVFDHVLRVIDTIDAYRDLLNGVLDIYLSSVSNRMNEIMKVLTVFATIFIPLTFIAGVYGMNFDYMPELRWRWSYPILWGLFLLIPAILLTLFRKKRWL